MVRRAAFVAPPRAIRAGHEHERCARGVVAGLDECRTRRKVRVERGVALERPHHRAVHGNGVARPRPLGHDLDERRALEWRVRCDGQRAGVISIEQQVQRGQLEPVAREVVVQEGDKPLQSTVTLDGDADREHLGGGEVETGVADEQREPRIRLQGHGEVLAGTRDDRIEGGRRLLDRRGVAGAGELDEQRVDVIVVEDAAGNPVAAGRAGNAMQHGPAGDHRSGERVPPRRRPRAVRHCPRPGGAPPESSTPRPSRHNARGQVGGGCAASAAWWAGSATAVIAAARARNARPRTSATPCSVTIRSAR